MSTDTLVRFLPRRHGIGTTGARPRRATLDSWVELLGQLQPGIAVAGPHPDRIEQLDAGHRNAVLDGLDGGLDGSLERLERAGSGTDRGSFIVV